MMTDPIADMLTRIRNAIQAGHKNVTIPLSKIKRRIADILKQEGYINSVEVSEDSLQGSIHIELRYDGATGESPIHGIKRESRPGRRSYADRESMPEVLAGMGVAIVSTSKGMMTGRDAKAAGVGGEVLLSVW